MQPHRHRATISQFHPDRPNCPPGERRGAHGLPPRQPARVCALTLTVFLRPPDLAFAICDTVLPEAVPLAVKKERSEQQRAYPALIGEAAERAKRRKRRSDPTTSIQNKGRWGIRNETQKHRLFRVHDHRSRCGGGLPLRDTAIALLEEGIKHASLNIIRQRAQGVHTAPLHECARNIQFQYVNRV